MTTLTIHIDNEKSEKAIKAVLDALDVSYQIEEQPELPAHVISGLLKSKEDVANNLMKEYQGLNALLATSLSIRKGNKRVNPKGLFGLWSDNPKSLESIRRNAWQRS